MNTLFEEGQENTNETSIYGHRILMLKGSNCLLSGVKWSLFVLWG